MDILDYTVIRWLINMSRGTCEKMLMCLVQAENKATEGHWSAREMRKHQAIVRKNKKRNTILLTSESTI